MSRHGFISFFTLALCCFFIAALAAIWITWKLFQTGQLASLNTNKVLPAAITPAPTQSLNLGLEPDIRIASEIDTTQDYLNRLLIIPMRSYYATKSDQLHTITIIPAETDSGHDLKVSITLVTADETNNLSFYYDQTDHDNEDQTDYPTWTPSLLDNI